MKREPLAYRGLTREQLIQLISDGCRRERELESTIHAEKSERGFLEQKVYGLEGTKEHLTKAVAAKEATINALLLAITKMSEGLK